MCFPMEVQNHLLNILFSKRAKLDSNQAPTSNYQFTGKTQDRGMYLTIQQGYKQNWDGGENP